MKKTVVFLHGDLLNHTLFKGIGSYLDGRGYDVIYVDFPGHGLTKYNSDVSSPKEFIKDFLNRRRIKNPIFVAHSSGAMVISDYIEETKNVSAIVFINPLLSSPKLCNPNVDILALFSTFKKVSSEKFERQELIDYTQIKDENTVREMGLKTTNPKAFAAMIDYYSSDISLNVIFDINIPILYIASINDSFMPMEYHKKMYSKMKNAKFLEIDSGHNPFIKDNDIVLKKIIDNYDFITL